MFAVIPQATFPCFTQLGRKHLLFRSTNRQTFCSEVINHSNRALSPFPKRQQRQGRVSNVTCWAFEEKQHCIQAQKTQSGGVHEPLWNVFQASHTLLQHYNWNAGSWDCVFNIQVCWQQHWVKEFFCPPHLLQRRSVLAPWNGASSPQLPCTTGCGVTL